MSVRLFVGLEFARAEETGEPHAFRMGVQEYLLRTEDSAYAAATLRWDDDLLREIAALREPDGDPALPRRLGARLGRFLSTTQFAAIEARIEAAIADGRSVEVVITASAAELYALPWELLPIGRSGRHLGEHAEVVLRYRWPGTAAAPPTRAPAQEGGRVLVVCSRAFGNVGETRMIEAIAGAAEGSEIAFDPARDVLSGASLADLARVLEGGDPPAVLHILCHGASTGGVYGLGLDDGRGGREVVDPATLARALAPFTGRIRLVTLIACDSGNPGPPGTQLGSAAQELHRAGFEAVVAARYPLRGSAALVFTQAFYEYLLRETFSVEQAFTAARTRLARHAGGDWACLQLYSHAPAGGGSRPLVFRPYRGLLAFEREHARFFFGRDAELSEAVSDFEALVSGGRPRLVVVTGAGGSGKSSLVLAGLSLQLVRRGWTVAVIRPGRAPLRALSDALARRRPGQRFVLVVDQFEELFTHAIDRGRTDEAQEFMRRLWDMVRGTDGSSAAVATLRVDFLGRCGELGLDADMRLDRLAYDEANRVFVSRMSAAGLTEAIERPAARVGLRLEPGLRETLLRDVGDEAGALPLLEYALDQLWQRRSGDELTHAALAEIGGVQGALTRHADATVTAMDPGAQAQTRRVLVRLVTYGNLPGSGVRRREPIAGLRSRKDPAAFERAIEALVAARLLVRRVDADGEPSLEVAHEALIRRWPLLWDWYQKDRDALTFHDELDRLVEAWRSYGPLSPKALAFAQEAVLKLDSDDVTPAVAEMLAVNTRWAQRRLWRRRATIGAVIASLLVLTLVVYWQYLRAEDNASEAARNAAIAETNADEARLNAGWAEEQRQRAETEARASADLARFAVAAGASERQPAFAASLLRGLASADIAGREQAVFDVLQSPLPRVVLPGDAGVITGGTFMAGGDIILVGRADGTVRARWLTDDVEETIGGDAPVIDIRAARVGDEERLAVLRRESIELYRRDDRTFVPIGGGPVEGAEPATIALGGVSSLVERFVGRQRHETYRLDGAGWTLVHRTGDCVDSDPRTETRVCHDEPQIQDWRGGRGRGRALSGRPPPARIQESAVGGDAVYDLLLPSDVAQKQICRVSLSGDEAPVCRDLPAACQAGSALVGTPAGDVAVRCADRVVVFERRRLATVVELPLSASARAFVDVSGAVAAVAADGSVWVWGLQSAPARLIDVIPGVNRGRLSAAPGGVAVVADHGAGGGAELLVYGHEDMSERSGAASVAIASAAERVRAIAVAGDAFAAAVERAGASRIRVGRVLAGGADVRTLGFPGGEVQQLAISGDGTRGIAAIDRGGRVTLDVLDLEADPVEATPRVEVAPRGLVVAGALDGRLAAFGVPGDRVFIFDVAAGTFAVLDDAYVGQPGWHALAVADGALAVGGPDNQIALYLSGPGRPPVMPSRRLQMGSRISALALSSDGTVLIATDTEGKIRVWTELAGDAAPLVLRLSESEHVAALHLDLRAGRLFVLGSRGRLRHYSVFPDRAALTAALVRRMTYCVPARQWSDERGVPAPTAEAWAAEGCEHARVGATTGRSLATR